MQWPRGRFYISPIWRGILDVYLPLVTSLKVIAALAKNKNFCEINDHDLIRVFVNVILPRDSISSHFFSTTS